MAEVNSFKDALPAVKDAAVQSGKIIAKSVGVEAAYNKTVHDRLSDTFEKNPLEAAMDIPIAGILQWAVPSAFEFFVDPNGKMDLSQVDSDAKTRKFFRIGMAAAIADLGATVTTAFALRNNPELILPTKFTYNALVNTAFETTSLSKKIAKFISKD